MIAAALEISDATLTTAGILLLTVVAVELGGLTVLRMTRGSQPATGFQKAFARAGRGRTEPNRLIYLLYAGIVALTVGVVTLGIGLLAA